MSESVRCAKCGAVLAEADASCTRCLLAGALENPEGAGLDADFLDDLPLPKDNAMVIAEKYTVVETIARGGMGVVYKAWQENLSRVVAVKMILGGAHASSDYKRRFVQEAKAAARLQHPNIVKIFDWGEDKGQPYFSMEYIEGKTLADLPGERPIDWARVAECARAISEAIAYAHAQGVLHRDLKPSNVLVDQAGQPRVTDFGLAKEVYQESELTATGDMMGTPGYSAPEQIVGDRARIGPASDVYGLGAILYYLLTGRSPFMAASLADTLRAVLEREPISPRLLNFGVPKDLETICLKCLRKEPSQRYPSATELGNDLDRWLRHEAIHAREVSLRHRLWLWTKRNPALAALLLFICLAVGSFVTQTERGRRQVQRERDVAVKERERAEETLSRMELGRAEDLLSSGNSPGGLAHLSRVLARERTNRVAAERMLNALSQRNFLLPLAPPIPFQLPQQARAGYHASSRAGLRVRGQFTFDDREIVVSPSYGGSWSYRILEHEGRRFRWPKPEGFFLGWKDDKTTRDSLQIWSVSSNQRLGSL